MMVHRANRRRGAILVAVLVCTMVATALIGLALRTALRSRREAQVQQRLAQTELLLQAGVQRAELHLTQRASDQDVGPAVSAGKGGDQEASNPKEEMWNVGEALSDAATATIQVTYSRTLRDTGTETVDQASSDRPASGADEDNVTSDSDDSPTNEPMNESYMVHVVAKYAGRGQEHTALQLSRSYQWTGAELKLLERNQ